MWVGRLRGESELDGAVAVLPQRRCAPEQVKGARLLLAWGSGSPQCSSPSLFAHWPVIHGDGSDLGAV